MYVFLYVFITRASVIHTSLSFPLYNFRNTKLKVSYSWHVGMGWDFYAVNVYDSPDFSRNLLHEKCVWRSLFKLYMYIHRYTLQFLFKTRITVHYSRKVLMPMSRNIITQFMTGTWRCDAMSHCHLYLSQDTEAIHRIFSLCPTSPSQMAPLHSAVTWPNCCCYVWAQFAIRTHLFRGYQEYPHSKKHLPKVKLYVLIKETLLLCVSTVPLKCIGGMEATLHVYETSTLNRLQFGRKGPRVPRPNWIITNWTDLSSIKSDLMVQRSDGAGSTRFATDTATGFQRPRPTSQVILL
jgi:hypothetical protein